MHTVRTIFHERDLPSRSRGGNLLAGCTNFYRVSDIGHDFLMSVVSQNILPDSCCTTLNAGNCSCRSPSFPHQCGSVDRLGSGHADIWGKMSRSLSVFVETISSVLLFMTIVANIHLGTSIKSLTSPLSVPSVPCQVFYEVGDLGYCHLHLGWAADRSAKLRALNSHRDSPSRSLECRVSPLSSVKAQVVLEYCTTI